MLILARKTNERIMIGTEIEIAVVEIRGDQVKLGIVAPPSIKVYRREVFDAIQAENQEAARTAPMDLAELSGLLSPRDKASGSEPGEDS